MKTKLFLLFFCVPLLLYGQTRTISNTATYFGAKYIYNPAPPWYTLQTSSTSIDVGNWGGQNGSSRGRGFLKFNVSSITTNELNLMYKAELVFNCGVASTSEDQSVKISLSQKTDVNLNATTAYSDLGSSNNLLIATAKLKGSTDGIRIPIDKKIVSDFRNANPIAPIPICLVHSDEINNGIIIGCISNCRYLKLLYL